MALGASYTTSTGVLIVFGMLVDPPDRDTTQQISERLIVGSNDAVVDVIGKPVTKIKGKFRIDGYENLKVFEGAVGTMGSLVYTEETGGLAVILVTVHRTYVQSISDIHVGDIEFWVIPTGAVLSGF